MDLQGLKFLVVGAGFFGATVAYRIASELDENVLVVERRGHIGGNCYSYLDSDTGIEVHKYGPHIFHTNNRRVWEFINLFASFNSYRHHTRAYYRGKTYPIPVNLDTIEKAYGRHFTPGEARSFIEGLVGSSKGSADTFEGKANITVGNLLFSMFFRGLTKKLWGVEPNELPASVFARLPVRFNYKTDYFDDLYQGIPVAGYGVLFDRMLSHPKITVRRNLDFFGIKDTIVPEDCTIVYSGPLDRYFNYRLGRLKWRTLDYVLEVHACSDFQGVAVVNYTDIDTPWNRITEFKHFANKVEGDTTVISREYAREARVGDDLFYPVNTEAGRRILARYQDHLVPQEKNVIFGGRLGGHRYINMDEAILEAFTAFERIRYGYCG